MKQPASAASDLSGPKMWSLNYPLPPEDTATPNYPPPLFFFFTPVLSSAAFALKLKHGQTLPSPAASSLLPLFLSPASL